MLLVVGEVVAKRLVGAASSESWAPKMDSRRVAMGRGDRGAAGGAGGGSAYLCKYKPSGYMYISNFLDSGVEGSFGIDSPSTDNAADSGMAFERGVVSRVIGALSCIRCKVYESERGK